MSAPLHPVFVGFELQTRPDLEKFLPDISAPGTYKDETKKFEYIENEKIKILSGNYNAVPYAGMLRRLYAISPVTVPDYFAHDTDGSIINWIRRSEEMCLIGFNVKLLLTFIYLRAAELGLPIRRTQLDRIAIISLDEVLCPPGVASSDRWLNVAVRRMLAMDSYVPSKEVGTEAKADAIMAAALGLKFDMYPEYRHQILAGIMAASSPAKAETKQATGLLHAGKKPKLGPPTAKTK